MPNKQVQFTQYKPEAFLLGLFLLCSFIATTEQGGIFGAPEALYKPTDHVVILNATNIKSTIYGTPNAWLVEFYSSWCGHCINFAPVYKQFAAEVEAWQNVVKIGGIDCADDTNTGICRDYDIMGYPTLLFFPPNSKETKVVKDKSELYRGEPFPRSDKVSQLKYDLMDAVAQHFQNILGEMKTTPTTFNAVWKYALQQSASRVGENGKAVPLSLVILLYENDKSIIGKELALRLSSYPQIRVVRFFKKNNLYERLGFKDDWPAAGYLKSDRKYGGISIPRNRDIVGVLLAAALKKLKEERSETFVSPKSAAPDAQLAIAEGAEEVEIANEKDVKEESSNLEEPASNTVSGDVVSLEDLVHAVRNSLRNEVGKFKTISGAKLKVLKDYIHLLGQLFPADRRELIVFLMKLDKWLEPQDNVHANQYLDKLTELELELHPWDIDINSWGTCRGSVPGRRGYTCGLWRLFHTLTLLSTQKSQDIFVLPIIYGYVKEFFGCTECVSHFTKMIQDEGALTITTVRSQALWLWRAHNKVNIRLKGSVSEDPGYPKGLYPSESLCTECHTAEGSFDEEKVLEYLIKVYTNPQRTMQSLTVNEGHYNQKKGPHQEQSTRSNRTSSRFFSGTDYWIFFIVYLSVAGLLIFGYIHFKYGSRRRLDPFAICRKVLHTSKSMV